MTTPTEPNEIQPDAEFQGRLPERTCPVARPLYGFVTEEMVMAPGAKLSIAGTPNQGPMEVRMRENTRGIAAHELSALGEPDDDGVPVLFCRWCAAIATVLQWQKVLTPGPLVKVELGLKE